MKKLLVLVLVLAMTQLSLAGLATLRIAGNDVKNDYTPSDIITIELVADFGVGSIGIDQVNGNPPGGMASAPALNSLFVDQPVNPGVIKNQGPLLIQGVAGFTALGSADIPAGQLLWSFEFHVPDLPPSTWIEITTSGAFLAAGDFSDMSDGTNAVMIHIIPEPVTIALLGLGGLFLRRRMA